MTFGLLNLNRIEILFLLGLAFVGVGVPVILLFVLRPLLGGKRQGQRSERERYLESEVHRLEEELAQLKAERSATGETEITVLKKS